MKTKKLHCLQKLASMMLAFRQLKSDLKLIEWQVERQNVLIVLVRFLNIVAPWCDRGSLKDIIGAFNGVKRDQCNGILSNLQALAAHLAVGVRSENGMNHTKRGERVIPEKVFVGDAKNGLLAKPVSLWVSDPQGDGYQRVCQQAKDFMAEHIEPMIKILKDLEAVKV